MSRAVVRSSKFRHVFGTPTRQEHCYSNIRITKSPFEGNMCAVNEKFVAVVLESQGGGAFTVFPMKQVGRCDINHPKVSGHKAIVLDIAWNPFDDYKIASSSEDCTVKVWEIPEEGLTENLTECVVEMIGHNRKSAHLQWHPTAENVLASSGYDNKIIIWNTETGEPMIKLTMHTDTIQSFDWNYNGSLLATTCKDKKIRVIDPRSGPNGEVISEGKGHDGTKASRVIFCGTTGKLFTTGFSRLSDRQYGVWDPKNLTSALTFENIDNGNGVLFPFWDEGTKMVYIAGKGDTQIKYFEIVEDTPYAHFLSMFQSTTPQRGLGVLPKRHVNYMMCEVMRFYKLSIKGIVEPIPMTVPRKSEMFQDDIYPPAFAGVACLTAEEWQSGVNKDPTTVSFTPTGLVLNKPPEAKKHVPQRSSKTPPPEPVVLTATQAKVQAFEKRSSSTELGSSRGGRGNSASVSPPPVGEEDNVVSTKAESHVEPRTDAEFRKAYYEVVAENEELKVQVADLKKKIASLERRATYKKH